MSVKIIKYGSSEDGAENSIEEGNIELLIKVTTQAKALCPVNHGLLRNSIMWKTDKYSGGFEEGTKIKYQPKKYSGVVGSGVDYAAYVNFGTRKMEAQPFLSTAVEIEVFGANASEVIKKASIREMKKALSKGKKVIR